jgi:hypothetical protein
MKSLDTKEYNCVIKLLSDKPVEQFDTHDDKYQLSLDEALYCTILIRRTIVIGNFQGSSNQLCVHQQWEGDNFGVTRINFISIFFSRLAVKDTP